MLDFLWKMLSLDMGIDLGTANTLIFIKDKGIAVREPSIVARQKKTGKILAIGTEAKKMVGKTPEAIEAIKPLKDGVIADFDGCEAMLHYYIRQLHQSPGALPKIPKPKVIIGIPSGVTEVERRAVQDAALSAGARKAYLIEEPMAAAIGADLLVESSEGHLIIDIGGGTTEIAVISLGGIVIERCLRVAGDEMDEAIINMARLKYGLVLGLSTAEEVKISIGSAAPFPKTKNFVIRGRDIGKGLPRSLKISSSEVREALGPVLQQIVGGVTDVLEETPPELLSDILEHGVVLAGGCSQLYGLDKVISEATKMPTWVVEDPMTAVVKGCGKLLTDQKLLDQVKVTGGLR
jgi:rod shape-determining protein MreB and related proteins